MADLDRELNWDDQIQKDSNFVELAAGDYNFTIDHYERGRSTGSDKIPPSNMAIVFFNIVAPDGQVATIRENFILHTKLEWKLSELFMSVGLKKKGEPLRMDWNQLPGLKGRCKVTLDAAKDDPTKKYNHISKLYPYEPPKYTAGQF